MADYVSPEARRRIATGLMAAQYAENPPTAPMGYDWNAAPLSPSLMNFAAQRGQPGVIQKTLGLIPGFDQDGKRGAQSWGNALMSTVQFPIDAVAGMGQAITAPARAYRGEFDPTSEEGVGEALNVAGNAMMGGLAAPKPRNVVGSAGGDLRGAALGAIPDTPGIRPYPAEATSGIYGASGLPGGFGAPNPMLADRPASGRPVPVLSRPGHLQGPAPHMTIADDLLPSASYAPWTVEGYNVDPTKIAGTRADLQQAFVDGGLPGDWFVHGRAKRGDLDTGGLLQGTQSPDTAMQYAGRNGGSIWAMRPAPDSTVLNFTSTSTPDIRNVTAAALRDDRKGVLPFSDDLANIPPAARSEAIRESFAPRDIVNSAQAFDNQNWTDWLHQTRKPDFVRTPDGGVAYGPDGVEAIRLFANGGRPGAATGAALGAIPDTPGIRAYHGSPHDFDRFDLSKIGTGEGAQAYGHGLYFAENEGVARSYRDALTDYGGNARWVGSGPEAGRNAALDVFNSPTVLTPPRSVSEAISVLEDRIAHRNSYKSKPGNFEQLQQSDIDALNLLRSNPDNFALDTPGRMYEVNIKANPDDFLDWDKPLSQQSDKSRKSIEQLIKESTETDAQINAKQYTRMAARAEQDGKLERAAEYRRLASKTPEEYAAEIMAENKNGSDFVSLKRPDDLRRVGLAGIRYFDGESRAAGEGTRNYVVFDDKLIEILRKYGLLGMAGGAAAAEYGGNSLMPSRPASPQYRPGDA